MSILYYAQLGALMTLAWIAGSMSAELRLKRKARAETRRRQLDAGLAAVAAARGRHPSSRGAVR